MRHPATFLAILSPALFACTSDAPGGGDATSDAASGWSADGGSDAGDGTARDATVARDGATDGGHDAAPRGPLVAYASGYGPDLAVYRVDAQSGALSANDTATAFGSSPSFLAVNPAATNLYAIDESGEGRVGAYAIDKTSGALRFLNGVSTRGNGPAFVSVDATGAWVMVANYGDGTIAVLPVKSDGRLGDAVFTASAGANAHQIVPDLSNAFVFVPCLGTDYIAEYRLDAVTGQLTPNKPATLAIPRGSSPTSGPRHLALHPNGKLAYVMNEKSSTITALTLDPVTGLLDIIESQSTLPSDFTGQNTGAEVWVHPSGKFVYGSNRGDDSIVVFAIDEPTGKLTLVGHTKTGGATPRSFTLDPEGRFLYAANQGSGTIVPFAIDPDRGTLRATAATMSLEAPSFVGVVHLPAP
jgi:6-phosphogluconolactonase